MLDPLRTVCRPASAVPHGLSATPHENTYAGMARLECGQEAPRHGGRSTIEYVMRTMRSLSIIFAEGIRCERVLRQRSIVRSKDSFLTEAP
jgi:hypothetical protein